MISILSRHVIVPYGTTQLRCIQPKEYLNNVGFVANASHVFSKVTGKEKIIILHRVIMDSYIRDIILYARMKGIILVFDTDDLLFTDEGANYLEQIGMKNYRHEQKAMLDVMQASDVILVSTSTLKAEAERLYSDVRLIKNALSREYIHLTSEISKRKDRSTTTVAYLSGSQSHNKDFAIIYTALLHILKARENVKLLIVGPLQYPDELKTFNNFEHREQVPYDQFVSIFGEIDINLVPLEINEKFCQSKSELKFIEAGACGVPSIASPTQPYSEVIEHKKNGMLAKDEEWEEQLLLLIDDEGLRSQLGREALKTVSRCYYPHRREQEWKQLINTILKDHHKESQTKLDTKRALLFSKLRLQLVKMSVRSKLRNFERVIRVSIRSKFPKKEKSKTA